MGVHMYIQVNDSNEVIHLITVGEMPEKNGYEISDDTPEDILKHIFDYKYVDGKFVKKEDADSNRLMKLISAKIGSLSSICRSVITGGIDFNNEQYSLEEHDQLNLNDLKETALQGNSVLYHADGNLFRVYSSEEILSLIKLSSDFKVFHNTYFNYLKSVVNNMTTIEEVLSVNYGFPLTPDLQESFNVLTKDMNFEIPEIEDTTDYSSLLVDVKDI